MSRQWMNERDAKHQGQLRVSAVIFCSIVCFLTAQLAYGQQPVICNGMQIGTVSFTAANGGVTGGFTATIDTNGDGKASLDEAAAKCGEDHFNWYQLVTSDTNPPNDAGGNVLVPPYVDPPPGGYGPPSTQWADNLPWYLDEGPDPPAGTPGFSDGFNVNDALQDTNGDGVVEHLQFFDFPNDADGNSVSFKTWLVSLNEDGSLHSFHDAGIGWTWTNPVTVPGSSDNTTTINQSLITGPSEKEFLPKGFLSSVPARVWDTVINDSNSPVDWGPGIWTRDGREIGRTFPNGITQPGLNPPEVDSDHITLPETPNDFHFDVFFPEQDTQISVWSFWEPSLNFGFDFDLFTVPGIFDLQLQYDFAQNFLLVQGETFTGPQTLYNGPLDLFDPFQIDAGFGPGAFAGATRLMETMLDQFTPNAIWDGDLLVGAQGDGTSWADANNWTTDDVADTAPSNGPPGDDVLFPSLVSPKGTAISLVSLGADRVVNSIRFEDNFWLEGHTLTVTSGAVDVVEDVTAEIDSDLFVPHFDPVTLQPTSLTKLGDGTLVANGFVVADVAVEEGILEVNGSVASPTVRVEHHGILQGTGSVNGVNIGPKAQLRRSLGSNATLRAGISATDNLTANSVAWGSGTFALQAVERRTAGLGTIGGEPAGDYSITVTTDSTGTPDTVPQPGDHIGHGNFVVNVNTSGELSANLFQAVSGDTNGDRQINNTDIVVGILGANSFGNGPGFDWTQGDFNGDTEVDNSDILAILATALFGTGLYAANPTDPGVPADGVADLVIHTDGTATLDTNGLAINGFILRSLGDNFTGSATLPFAFFQTNDEDEASVGFATPPVTGLVDLGQLYKPGSLPIRFSDLDFTYTVANTAGLFDGNCIGCVPEPSTIVLLVMGVAGLWMIRRRPCLMAHPMR